MTIASASWRIFTRSRVTSPRIRMASPGPGKGCRQTLFSSIPMAIPNSRTSSLNNSLIGSISFRCIEAGRPPTLWWVLMVADGPLYEIDSMTSGYRVPCNRYSHFTPNSSSILADSSWKMSIKVVPMIFRFFSGSVTPASLSRKRSDASTTRRFTWHSSRMRFKQFFASSFLRHPLSTIKAWNRSPMAWVIRTAATVESTPPLTAPITWLSPTCLRTSSINSLA
mmetsp:Transcript_11015/g.23367  ORF Transcript_11015/g.23367 Transcript_11015/m.23367 type:complete len:224 (+) Transcript_11015:575-1246(+)